MDPVALSTKLQLNTPQCIQNKSNMTSVYWGKFVCSWNNFRSQTTSEFLQFVVLISTTRDRKLPNYLLSVATKPQIKEIQA